MVRVLRPAVLEALDIVDIVDIVDIAVELAPAHGVANAQLPALEFTLMIQIAQGE